jgi:hypothetical protein
MGKRGASSAVGTGTIKKTKVHWKEVLKNVSEYYLVKRFQFSSSYFLASPDDGIFDSNGDKLEVVPSYFGTQCLCKESNNDDVCCPACYCLAKPGERKKKSYSARFHYIYGILPKLNPLCTDPYRWYNQALKHTHPITRGKCLLEGCELCLCNEVCY